MIVFSQPLDTTTVTSANVQLTLNGVPVPATLVTLAGQPWVVHLSPTTLLAPSSTYHIVVTSGVRDINGSRGAIVFIVSMTLAVLASFCANTCGPNQFWSPVASPGGTIQFTAYRVTSAGDTLVTPSNVAVDWMSSASAIATVDSLGLMSAVAPGVATIAACSGTICGGRLVHVIAPGGGIPPQQLGDLGGGMSYVQTMRGGFVVGNSSVATPPGVAECDHAFLWSAARGMEDLGVPNGDCSSYAFFISDSEVVVGVSPFFGHWIWRRTTGIQPLTYPDQAHAPWYPAAMSGSGEVLFNTPTIYPSVTSVIGFWSAAKGARVVALPISGEAMDMNDVGQVLLRTSSVSGGVPQDCGPTAYIWDGATSRVSATITGLDPATRQPLIICAQAINNHGAVTGYVNPTHPQAFRWTGAGGFTFLPLPRPGMSSGGRAINDAGDVSGYVVVDSLGVAQGAVWLAAGGVTLLGSLGGNQDYAVDLNDAHLVAGYSRAASGAAVDRAVIWDLTAATGASLSSPASMAPGRRIAPPALAPTKRVGHGPGEPHP